MDRADQLQLELECSCMEIPWRNNMQQLWCNLVVSYYMQAPLHRSVTMPSHTLESHAWKGTRRVVAAPLKHRRLYLLPSLSSSTMSSFSSISLRSWLLRSWPNSRIWTPFTWHLSPAASAAASTRSRVLNQGEEELCTVRYRQCCWTENRKPSNVLHCVLLVCLVDCAPKSREIAGNRFQIHIAASPFPSHKMAAIVGRKRESNCL